MGGRSIIDRFLHGGGKSNSAISSQVQGGQTAADSSKTRIPIKRLKTVTCDQAVFTSVRGPGGEGYRIIASSAGVKAEEKNQITRFCPSHGGLLSEAEDAVGLLAFEVASGRYCVCHSRYAGNEHTARGGQRVWTHIAIIDREDYFSFDCNPVHVHRALAKAIIHAPPLPPPKVLDPLELDARDWMETPPSLSSEESVNAFVRLVSTILTGGKWIVAGTHQPFSMLEWAVEMIPAPARTGLSVTAGLAFSLSRKADLVIIDADKTGIARKIKGHNIDWCDLDSTEPVRPGAFDPWLKLIQCWIPEGRLFEISELTRRIPALAEPEPLNRIAQLCTDADPDRYLDQEVRSALKSKYSTFTPANEVERELRAKLLDGIEQQEQLELEQQEAESSEAE